jgi:hypothetical protein
LYLQTGGIWTLLQNLTGRAFQFTLRFFKISLMKEQSRNELTNELPQSVVKDSLTTAADGKRYKTKSYNLSMILAIGYRVESHRGIQFRKWATMHLQEYPIKGFVMDDARLKERKTLDYILDDIYYKYIELKQKQSRIYGTQEKYVTGQ